MPINLKAIPKHTLSTLSCLNFLNTNHQTFYGGYTIDDMYSLDGNEILNNTNLPLHINLLGYIEIINNIQLKDFSNNTLTFGSLYDKDYENTFIKGVNSNIHNFYYLNLESWGNVTIQDFKFFDLRKVVIEDGGNKKELINIDFINKKNLEFFIKSSTVTFDKVKFNILDNSELNFILQGHNFLINGNPITIIGSTTAQANIFIGSNKNQKYSVNIVGLNTYIKTNFNLENSILNIEDNINFYSNKNKILITNSELSGKINFLNNYNLLNINNSLIKDFISFYGKDNTLLLNNVQLDKNAAIQIYNSGNFIKIYNNFSGLLKTYADNNSLLFQNANLENASIFTKHSTLLNFEESFINKNTNIYFTDAGINNVVFKNSISNGNLYFANNNTNTILFKENTQNILGGVIFLNKDSLLNIKLENNSIASLNFKINLPINELFIGENSQVIISKNGIITQTWIQKGDINLTIHLDDNVTPVIYAKTTKFNNNTIFLNTYNLQKCCNHKEKTKEIELFKTETNITNLKEIILNSKLIEYKIIYKEDSILLSLKKKYDFVDLLYKEQLNNSNYTENLLSIAKYLDKLWLKEQNSTLSDLLDYAANITGNTAKMISFFSTLMPISNKVLYTSILNNNFNLVKEAMNFDNSVNDTQIWSKTYYNTSEYLLSNSILKSNDQGMLLGYNYSISNKNKLGYYVGIGLGSIKGSNYNVNSLNINVGLYNKSIITKKLSNINSLNIVGSKFFIDRYVYKNEYTHINSSIPMGMNYGISSYWKYDFNLLSRNVITYTISPQVNLYLGYINLSPYVEKGPEALNVNGFNSYVSIAEGGVLNTLLINKNTNVKYIFNLSFMGGREYNNLKNIIFNFKDSSVNERCEFQEPYNNTNYFKISFYFSHVAQDNKLGFNLQCSYKTNKIYNNAHICLGMYLKL